VPRPKSKEILERGERIIQLLRERGEMTCQGVAWSLDLSVMQAYYVLRLLCIEGRVKRRKVGRTYYYYLPD